MGSCRPAEAAKSANRMPPPPPDEVTSRHGMARQVSESLAQQPLTALLFAPCSIPDTDRLASMRDFPSRRRRQRQLLARALCSRSVVIAVPRLGIEDTCSREALDPVVLARRISSNLLGARSSVLFWRWRSRTPPYQPVQRCGAAAFAARFRCMSAPMCRRRAFFGEISAPGPRNVHASMSALGQMRRLAPAGHLPRRSLGLQPRLRNGKRLTDFNHADQQLNAASDDATGLPRKLVMVRQQTAGHRRRRPLAFRPADNVTGDIK